MAKKEWRSASDLYYHQPQKAEQKKKAVTLDDDASPQPEKDEPEVRLLKATWKPGSDGYQFNKKCKLQIKAKFLKKTSNKRVIADTFVLFNGEEEDLGQQVEGFLNDDGIAEAELMLYYGDKYSDALQDDPGATCQYKCKVKHTKGANKIESGLLEMPNKKKATFRIKIDIPPDEASSQDDVYSLFSTDEKQSYKKELTVKDDLVPGDQSIDLEFTDLDENLSYSLEVDPGKEGISYFIFENTPFKEL